MGKVERYELIYIKFSWVFTLVVMVGIVLNIVVFKSYPYELSKIITDFSFLCSIIFLNLVKYVVIKKGWFARNSIYAVFRIIEVLILGLAAMYLSIAYVWAYMTIVLISMITGLCKGVTQGLTVVVYSYIIYFILILAKGNFNVLLNSNFLKDREFVAFNFYYLEASLFTALCGIIYNDNLASEEENKRLLNEVGDKYKQLTSAQEEAKTQYEKLKYANSKLEETNKKLTSSIAEFFTLQQISQAISSIFDIKELLKYVNDIILGVMGVSNSTIILFDEKRKKLRVHTTNIKNREELALVNDNINSDILLEVLNKGKPLIENNVDPEKYMFAKARKVLSFICVPLITKSHKFGLVLIEHKYADAFDKENVRLLDVIGQQVGIAIENAELYQKMQEMATIDGLTEVYNRLYFQERLQKEFIAAKEGNYDLSLAIFDIDHFKRFNDTYGHLFGDKVLKSMAQMTRNSLRSSDVLARFGGEEFIILFPRASLHEAYEKVEFLRSRIAQSTIKDNLVETSVTVSFGIACFPVNCSSETELIRKADDALYEAKNCGRNCVKISNS